MHGSARRADARVRSWSLGRMAPHWSWLVATLCLAFCVLLGGGDGGEIALAGTEARGGGSRGLRGGDPCNGYVHGEGSALRLGPPRGIYLAVPVGDARGPLAVGPADGSEYEVDGAAGQGVPLQARRPRRPGATRYGEAENPGPASWCTPQVPSARLEVDYRPIDQPGFHGARSCGHGEDAGAGEGAARRAAAARADGYQLAVDTCNGTTWPGIRRYLRRTRADLVLAQEHHLPPAAVPGASQQALRMRWQSIWLPACQGSGGGWSAGVVIFARDPVRIAFPRRGGCEVAPHRVVAAQVEAPGYRPFTAYSGYLKDGEGLSKTNLGILADVGAHVNLQGDNAPFLVGADFQMTPQVLATAGFTEQCGGRVVATGLRRGTCRSTRANTEIDYFVMSTGMALGLAGVATVEGTGTRPHVPVRATFHAQQVSMRAMVLRKPPRLPHERLVGPLPPERDWSDLTVKAEKLVGDARTEDRGTVFREFAALYSEWADRAEQELLDVTGPCDGKAGLRGRAPNVVWRSIVPERPPQRTCHRADAWRWAATLAWDLRRASRFLIRGARLDLGGAGVDARVGGDDDLADAAADDADADVPPWMDEDLDDAHRDARDAGGVPIGLLDETVDVRTCAWDPPEAAMAAAAEGEVEGHDLAAFLGRVADMSTELEQVAADGGCTRATDADAERRRVALVMTWDAQLAELEDYARRATKAADDEEARSERESWRAWLRANLDKGARNAHLALSLPEEWRPTTVEVGEGELTADPIHLLSGYVDKYRGLWDDDDDDGEFCGDEELWARRTALPRPSAAEVREAARTFSAATSDTYDGFHMRHYDLLGDAALGIVAAFMEVAELLGGLPEQLRLIPMPLIGKARGGHRAIASLVSLYRLWARVRRPYAQEWEEANERHYFAAGKGRAPCDVVWRQAARAEASVGGGGHAGSILWDMASFFEKLSRRKLRRRVVEAGFPVPIARLALAVYSGPRMLSLNGAMSAPSYAWRGITAGCGFATTFVRIYSVAPFDRMVRELKWEFGEEAPDPDSYIDDITLSATGTEDEVYNKLALGYEILKEVVEDELECRVEVSKAAIVASSKRLVRRLMRKLGPYAGAPCEAAVNLGIDFAPGQRRAVQAKSGRRNKRMRGLTAKAAKLAGIRPIVGRKAGKIFASGPLPFGCYDAPVNGVSDAELTRVRRAAGRAFTPKAKGRSLSMLLLLEGVPTWRAEVAVVMQYCKEVWRASLIGSGSPQRGEMTLGELNRIYHAVNISEAFDVERGSRRWHNARGPIAAMALTLHRLSWAMQGPFTFITDRGDEIQLTKYSPALMAMMLKDAIARALQRSLGARAAAEGDARFEGRRLCLDHVVHRLRSDKSLGPKERAIYRSVLCDAVMTYEKAARNGYLVANRCPLCGCHGDSIHHRVWACLHPDVVAAREAAAPWWLIEEARRAGPSSWLYCRGVIPHPGDVWPRPTGEASMFVYPGGHEMGDGGLGKRTADSLRERPPTWALEEGQTRTTFCAAAAREQSDASGTPLRQGAIHLAGQLYVDGSCTTNIFPELCRAAAAVVVRPLGSEVEARMLIPVWRQLPQTPQAAEYVGLAVPFQHLSGHAVVASDCANAVRDFRRPFTAAMRPNRVYAGVVKDSWAQPGRSRAAVTKVKAHRTWGHLEAGEERCNAIGNDEADVAAKVALQLHEPPPPAEASQLDADCKRANIIIKTIAATMAAFPPMPRERMVRRPPARGGAVIDGEGGHQWRYEQGFWRCERCLRCTAKPEIPTALVHSSCSGPKQSLTLGAIAGKGHRVACTADSLRVVFCTACGAFSWRRAYGLATACPLKATPAGAQALARIRRGQAPWEVRVRSGRYRPAIGRQSVAWDGASNAPVWVQGDGKYRRKQGAAGGRTRDDAYGGGAARAADGERSSAASDSMDTGQHEGEAASERGDGTRQQRVRQRHCQDQPLEGPAPSPSDPPPAKAYATRRQGRCRS